MRPLGDKGFTLIELLVVVGIVGILAAVAIPQFVAYRQKAFDTQAMADLRNTVTAEEAYFAAYSKYLACSGPGRASTCNDPKIRSTISGLTEIAMVPDDADPGHFTGTSKSKNGSGATCHWDNQKGGLQGCS